MGRVSNKVKRNSAMWSFPLNFCNIILAPDPQAELTTVPKVLSSAAKFFDVNLVRL